VSTENLHKWALLAEIIGGIAVVLTLIFVGLQIRQSSVESSLNTRAIEVSAYQELSNQINAVSFEAMTNSDFAELLRSVFQDEISDISPIDQRVLSYLGYTIRHADMAYFQFKHGLIDEEQLHSMIAPLRGNLRSRVGKKHWSNQAIYTAEFVEYVEEHMQDRYPSDDYWQADS